MPGIYLGPAVPNYEKLRLLRKWTNWKKKLFFNLFTMKRYS